MTADTTPGRFVLATDHEEEARLDNVPALDGRPVPQFRCQCPMCEHHRTAEAINAERRG